MNRRKVLQMMGVAVPTVLLGAKEVFAQAAPAGGSAVQISRNHGHALEIPMADLMSGDDLIYDIQGASGHPHEVVINSGDAERILNGELVEIESSNDFGHTHLVSIELQSLVSN